MRTQYLRHGDWQKADNELKRQCRKDGMWGIRIRWVMFGLKLAGGAAAHPSSVNKVHTV